MLFLQAPSIYIPYKDTVTCRNIPWNGPLPYALASSGTIPTDYGIFISAEEDAEPENARFDGGLLKVGIY